jgi:hypothetical protein
MAGVAYTMPVTTCNPHGSAVIMQKIAIIIAYYYPPDPAVGGQRPARFTRYLPQFGYTPYVITASKQPANGPQNVIYCQDAFPNVRNGVSWQIERAVRKVALPGEEGLMWSLQVQKICRDIIKRVAHSRVAVISTFPPLGAHFAGLRLSYATGIPWIADFRDPFFNDPGRRLHMTKFQVNAARRLERIMTNRARFVVLNSDAMLAEWKEHYPDQQDKFKLIWNGFDPADVITARPVSNQSVHSMLHIGSLYGGRHPNHILASMDRLITRGAIDSSRVSFKLIGPFDREKVKLNAELVDKGEQQGWLHFCPPIPHAEAQRKAAEAHSLVLLQPQSRIQVPAKLFEYVRIGRPILSYVPRDSAIERVLRQSGLVCEFIYSDDTPEATDEKLLRFLALRPDVVRPSASFEEDFNGANQTRTLSLLLDRALGVASTEGRVM